MENQIQLTAQDSSFSPSALSTFVSKKDELVTIAKSFENLQINGVDDKEGYKAVDEARKTLKKERLDLTKTGKSLRTEAQAFVKKVIATEKELVALIAPVEQMLDEKQKKIDQEIAVEKRRKALPERRANLESLGLTEHDDVLLAMDDDEFNKFFLEKEKEKIAKDKAEIEAEKLRLAKEAQDLKQQEEIAKARKEAAEQAEIEAKKKAEQDKLDAEAAAKKAAEEAKLKAEKEKQDAIDAEKKKADEAVAAEKKRADDEIARIRKEQEDKEAAAAKAAQEEADRKLAEEKAKKEAAEQEIVKAWLEENGYTEETKQNFKLVYPSVDKIQLFKLVGEYKISA